MVPFATLALSSGSLTEPSRRACNSEPDASVHWRDLKLCVGDRTLVHPQSGTARAGRLMGVLGPSGAGKTSLLSALAGVLSATTTVSGAVWQAAGDKDDPAAFRRVGVAEGTVALLEQDDSFFPELTVAETLRFASQLEGMPNRLAQAETRTLLRQVGLEGVSARRVGERRIGTGARGISGGERRRLAVACAIAGEEESSEQSSCVPRAVFADEPTTGLDAFQAERVVKLLRSLAVSRRCAVVATLHQPRGSIWLAIDDIILMAPGGHVVYCGPTQDALAYFRRIGYSSPAAGVAPAEFLIDLVSINTEDDEMAAKDRLRIEALAAAWQRELAANAASLPSPPAEMLATAAPPPSGKPSGLRTVRRVRRPVRAFGLLLKRSLLQNVRDRTTNILRLASTLGLSMVFGAQFGLLDQGGAPTATSVASRVALLSYGVISMGMLATMRALDRFAKERPIVGRERAEGKYGGVTYLAAKAVAEVPSDAMFAALFAVMLRQQTGLAAPLPLLVAANAMLASTSAALGLAVGAAAPRAEHALAVGAPIMVIHMLVGVIDPAGASSEQDGALMRTLRMLSPVRHAIEALCLSELKDLPFAKPKGGFLRALAQGPQMGALAGGGGAAGSNAVVGRRVQGGSPTSRATATPSHSHPLALSLTRRPGAVRSGNEVLSKLGMSTAAGGLKAFAEPMRWLAILGVGHLAASAVALILAAPRFARLQPHREPDTASEQAEAVPSPASDTPTKTALKSMGLTPPQIRNPPPMR